MGLGKTMTSVDNPEYIIGQAAPSHLRSATAAPPSAALSDANRVGLPIVGAPANGGVPRYMTTQRSSEEESDHEYYNDFDRLQRELQPLKPLRRNETTVWEQKQNAFFMCLWLNLKKGPTCSCLSFESIGDTRAQNGFSKENGRETSGKKWIEFLCSGFGWDFLDTLQNESLNVYVKWAINLGQTRLKSNQ